MYSNWQCFFYISLIFFMHIVFLKKLARLVTCTYPKWGELILVWQFQFGEHHQKTIWQVLLLFKGWLVVGVFDRVC